MRKYSVIVEISILSARERLVEANSREEAKALVAKETQEYLRDKGLYKEFGECVDTSYYAVEDED